MRTGNHNLQLQTVEGEMMVAILQESDLTLLDDIVEMIVDKVQRTTLQILDI